MDISYQSLFALDIDICHDLRSTILIMQQKLYEISDFRNNDDKRTVIKHGNWKVLKVWQNLTIGTISTPF